MSGEEGAGAEDDPCATLLKTQKIGSFDAFLRSASWIVEGDGDAFTLSTAIV